MVYRFSRQPGTRLRRFWSGPFCVYGCFMIAFVILMALLLWGVSPVQAAEVTDLTVAPNEDNTALVLKWTNPAEGFDHAVVYRLYWEDYWDNLESTSENTFIDNDVEPYNNYTYKVVLVDEEGNESTNPPIVSGALEADPIIFDEWDICNNGVVNSRNADYFWVVTYFKAEQDLNSIEYSYSSDNGATWQSMDSFITWDGGLSGGWSYSWSRYLDLDLTGLADGNYQLRATATDVTENTLSKTFDLVVDATAQNVTGLTVTPNEDNTALVLNWVKPAEEVQSYSVYRYDEYSNYWGYLGDTTECTYTDTGALLYRTYTYKVLVEDAQGNVSIDPPTATGRLESGPITFVNWSISNWGNITSGNVDKFNVWASFAAAQDITSIDYSYSDDDGATWKPLDLLMRSDNRLRYNSYDNVWDRSVQCDFNSLADGVYLLKATATDANGNTLIAENVLNKDIAAPAGVSGLTVKPSEDGTAFVLSWENPTEDFDHVIIQRRYNSTYWSDLTGPLTEATYTDSDEDITAGITYEYRVITVDKNGNRCENPPEVSVVISLDGPFYTEFAPQDAVISGSYASRHYKAQFLDDQEVTSIVVEVSDDGGVTWQPLNAGNTTPTRSYNYYTVEGYWDLSNLGEVVYQIRARATDAGGREGFSPVYTITIDRVPPETPANFIAVSTASGIQLSWSPVDGAESYEIRRDGHYQYWTVNPPEYTLLDTGVQRDIIYVYKLTAKDEIGNKSPEAVAIGDYYSGPSLNLANGLDFFTTEAAYTLSGQTEPGAELTVNGTGVAVDEDGAFAYETTLAEGVNTFTVSATNAAGTHTLQQQVTLDMQMPMVYYFTPDDGYKFNGHSTVNLEARARDDHGTGVTRIAFEVTIDDGQNWAEIGALEGNELKDSWSWEAGERVNYWYGYFNWDPKSEVEQIGVLADGAYKFRAIAYDKAGNASNGTPVRIWQIDKTPPDAPRNLVAAADGVNAIKLTWTANTETDLYYYQVYRSTTPGSGYEYVDDTSTDSYRDTSVKTGIEYYYVVTAKDKVGNESIYSAEVAVKSQEDTIPPVITNTTPQEGAIIGGPAPDIKVGGADNSLQGIEKFRFEYSNDGGASWVVIGTYSAVKAYNDTYSCDRTWPTEGLTSGEYQLRFTAIDYAGNETSMVRSITLDVEAGVPQNLTAAPDEGVIILNWDEVFDADFSSYKILRSDAALGTYYSQATLYTQTGTYTDTDVKVGNNYYYKVIFTDKYGNSAASNIAYAKPGLDITAPEVIYLDPDDGATTGGPKITMNARATDNQNVKAMQALYSINEGAAWEQIATNTNVYNSGSYSYTTFNWYTDGLVSGDYLIRIKAWDEAGNEGYQDYHWVLDLSVSPVENLRATPDESSITLTWDAPEDTDLRISPYTVWRSEKSGGPYYQRGYSLSSTTTNFRDTNNLQPDKSYYYIVKCEDQLGNVSVSEEICTALLGETIPPSISKVEPADGSTIGGAKNQRLQVFFEENSGMYGTEAEIEYSLAGFEWAPVIGTIHGPDYNSGMYRFYLDWDLRPLASGSYMVRYTVRDGSGNEDAKIVTYQVDRTAPSAPANLKGAYGSGIVSLTWEAVTGAGVEKYNIYRASAAEGPFAVVGSVDGENNVTYTDATVQTGLTYWYRVTAVDNFDQEGVESNTVAVAAREDDIPPVVLGIEPADGTIFGPLAEISVRAEDNLALANITLQYSDNDGSDWADIDTKVPVDGVVTFTWHTPLLNGEVLVRAIARDARENKSDGTPEIRYVLDRSISPVTNLVAIPDESGITISWDASEDLDLIAKPYSLWRSETPGGPYVIRGTFSAGTTSYRDTYNLSADKNFYYIVKTEDQVGNIAQSEEICSTLLGETVPPYIVEIDPVNGSTFGGATEQTLVVIFDENSGRYGTEAEFAYSTDGSQWTPVGGEIRGPFNGDTAGRYYYSTSWDLEPLTSGTYMVRYTVRDGSGNIGQQIATYQVDRTAPAAPVNLTGRYGIGMVELSWWAPEDTDITHYNIYRAANAEGPFSKIDQVMGREIVTYTDTTMETGLVHWYKVTAVDRYGQEGAASNTVAVAAHDDVVAPVVMSIKPDDFTLFGPLAEITVRAEDNVHLAEITLQYSDNGGVDWVDISTAGPDGNGIAEFEWSTAPLHGNVLVRAIARDARANESDGTPVRRYVIDNQGPAQVTGVTCEVTATSVLLRWNKVPDDDFGYFLVERKTGDDTFENIGTVPDKLGYLVTGLAPDTTYWFRVVACDKFGNRGIPSEVVEAYTIADTDIPVVTRIGPAPGAFSDEIPLTASAVDNNGIASFIFKYSADGENWIDLATVEGNNNSSANFSYKWDVAAVAEGIYYITGVAYDLTGNASDMNNTPIVQYMVDRTAPVQPPDFNVTASSGYVTLTWSQNPELDLAGYKVYRSVDEAGPYSLVDSVSALGYIDRDVEQGRSYFYKVTALDVAGNESAMSGPLTARLTTDADAPRILSISPASGSTLAANPTITVLAVDDYRLSKVTFEYQDGESWTVIGSKDVNVNNQVVSIKWDTTGLTDGNYNVRVAAADQSGNLSAAVVASYSLNVDPPAVPLLTVTPGGWQAELSWTSGNEPDLAGFHLYRASDLGGPYKLIKKTTKTSYVDTELSPGLRYYYQVEAVDHYYNTARSEIISVVPTTEDTYAPTADAGEDQVGTVGLNMYFDGTLSSDNDRIDRFEWDLGDGTKSSVGQPVHAYQHPGDYVVTLTVYDPAGNRDTASFNVTVLPKQEVGILEVKVIDDANGSALVGSSIVVQFPDGTTQRSIANNDGVAYVVANPGNYKVYAYKHQYTPGAIDATLVAGQQKNVTVALKRGQLVIGELNVRRMTLTEIIDEGIDVNAPENQNVYKFEVHLAFNNKPLPPVEYIVNGAGGMVGGGDGGDGGGGLGGGGGLYFISDGEPMIAYPSFVPSKHPEVRPTIAYLVIPGEARWLKEFFEVGLVLENTADPDIVIADSTATLMLPEGLALAPTREKQELQVDLGELAGGESREVKWIIRGDEKGDYNLEAEFSGTLQPFGEPVVTIFQTREPFRVWGGDALHMFVDAQDQTAKGYPYHVRFGIQNISDVPVYNLAIELKDAGKQNYIYAPNQQLVESIQELPPGQILWKDYQLIPCIEGVLDLSNSYVLMTGGNQEVKSSFMEHAVPEYEPENCPVLRQTNKSDGTVELSWDAVEGSTGYRIYKVRDDLLISMEPELVYQASPDVTSVNLPEPEGPKDYIINTVLPDGEIMRHAMTGMSWEESAGLPVITVDPVSVKVGTKARLWITVNKKGWPVAGGTVDVGTYAKGVKLNENGQAWVDVTPQVAEDIIINAYDPQKMFLVSTVVHIIADPPPAAPTGLVAEPKDGKALLTWDENTEADLEGYNVYQLMENNEGQKLVRIRVTLENPGQKDSIMLKYREVDDGNYYPLTFNESGVAWYGPAGGFPLSNASSDFKVSFSAPGTYGYTLEIVAVEDGAVLASTGGSVEVTEAQIAD